MEWLRKGMQGGRGNLPHLACATCATVSALMPYRWATVPLVSLERAEPLEVPRAAHVE